MLGKDSISYQSDSEDYKVNVLYDVDSIDIGFSSNFEVYTDILLNDGHNSEFKLKVGSNKVKITVIAENGDTRNYSLVVNRAKPSAKLASLQVNEYYCGTDVNSYDLNVDYDTTKVKISAVAVDKSAKVTGNGTYNLKVGTNKFTITVTAADKTQKRYSLTVNRSKSSPKVIIYWVLLKD